MNSTDALGTVETITQRRPDLVVLAPLSRSADGHELKAVLDVKDRIQYTPVILVTALEAVGETLRRMARLFDDVVPRRALTETHLLDRVSLALGRLEVIRRLEEDRLSLERQSITDFKTGTFNDRYFHRRLREEFSRARRQRAAMACVMLDFDNFKAINDSFDHAFGDFVLLAFAKKLRSVIRDVDIPARLGGDEFVLLLPNTGLAEAVRIAERLRTIVGAYRFEREGRSTSVTLSIGIASFDGVEESAPETLLHQADCALMEAKRRGRNRVLLWPQVAGAGPAEGGAAGGRDGDVASEVARELGAE